MADPTPPKLPREVPVRLDDGRIGTVPRKDLQQAIDSGAEVVSGEELRKAKQEAEFGGVGGAVKSFGLSALRGATLGLSDVALTGSSAFGDAKANREMLAGYQEANPIASGAGELAGVLAPTLLSGGIATPAGAVGALGSAAERGVGKVLGEGLLGKVAGMGVQGAVEGGLFGGASAISEAAIHDHDLTAEQVLASAGKGALFGGAIGGGLGLAGAGLKYAGSRAVEALADVGGEASSVGGKLSDVAEGQAWRALSANKAITKEALERVPGGTKGIGRRLLDDGILGAGEDIEAIAPKIAAKLDEAGEKIGTVLRRADDMGYEGAKVQNILSRMDEEIGGKFRDLGELASGPMGKLEQAKSAVASVFEGQENASFTKLQQLRRKFDEITKFTATDPNNQVLQMARGIMEDELEKAGDAAAKKIGGDFAAEYKAAKLEFQQYKVANKAAENAVTSNAANQALGLGDKMAGAATLAGGLVSGNPLAAVKGLGMAYGAKMLRERGNSALAVMLDKAGGINALKSINVSFGETTQKAAQAIVGGARRIPTATVASSASRTKATQKEIEQLQNLAANPGALSQRVAQQVDAKVAPSVAASYGMAVTRAVTYLASQAPKGQPISPAFPTVTRPPSKLELMQFQRKLDIFDDPIGTTTRAIKSGGLTMEHVQALENMYPRVLAELRMSTMERFAELAQKGKLPPYERRVQLGTLLGVPLDPSQDPAFMQAQQQLAEAQAQTAQQPPPQMAGKPPAAAKNMQTQSEQMEAS